MVRPRRQAHSKYKLGATESGVTSVPHPYRDINFELWSQKFVGASGNLDAELLDAFLPNETFAKHAELYPNKLLNLQSRTLRMGSITYVPYTVTNYVPAGEGNCDPIRPHEANRSIAFYGTEANLMHTFCEVHNCRLRVEAYGADNWGSIYENESADGLLGDLYLQRIELAIGCIYNWYNNITETSSTIARSAVTVLGPAPAPLPAWVTDTLPFAAATWRLLLATIAVCSVVLCVLRYSNYLLATHRRPAKSHWRVNKFACSFNRFATRFFLATLLSATITLENIYSGQLKSLLTVPFYGAPVDTVQKWAQTQWKWAAPSIIWVHTVENSDLVSEQMIAQSFEVRDYSYMYNSSFAPNYGLGIERLTSGAFTFGNYVTHDALENRIVLHDDLYFDWTRAVSIRGWPLMPLLNRHIRQCQESGLYVHWELTNVVKYLDKKTGQILFNQASGQVAKKAPKQLNVNDISAALFVLAFGLTIAACALLLEHMHQRLLILQRWCN
ncbi:Ir92a [Drosophila busckii]|uniref:Ir92a n=1 Tax=Drosophila busckii TaxID=30019 RepID=A0A0M3QYE0_DROBS|nr:Ir92a [Drosophila busckii]